MCSVSGYEKDCRGGVLLQERLIWFSGFHFFEFAFIEVHEFLEGVLI